MEREYAGYWRGEGGIFGWSSCKERLAWIAVNRQTLWRRMWKTAHCRRCWSIYCALWVLIVVPGERRRECRPSPLLSLLTSHPCHYHPSNSHQRDSTAVHCFSLYGNFSFMVCWLLMEINNIISCGTPTARFYFVIVRRILTDVSSTKQHNFSIACSAVSERLPTFTFHVYVKI